MLTASSFRSATFNPSSSANGCNGFLLDASTLWNQVIHICGTLMQLLTALLVQLHQSPMCAASDKDKSMEMLTFSVQKRERETRHVCNWQNHCYYSQPVSDCRRERAFVSQIKNKEIKTAWKLQKQRETDVCTGWCNVCAEMKVKGADTDSVLNTGKQNSFQPDGGSPTATRLYRGHSISVSRQMCVFVCRLLQERYCCTVYL